MNTVQTDGAPVIVRGQVISTVGQLDNNNNYVYFNIIDDDEEHDEDMQENEDEFHDSTIFNEDGTFDIRGTHATLNELHPDIFAIIDYYGLQSYYNVDEDGYDDDDEEEDYFDYDELQKIGSVFVVKQKFRQLTDIINAECCICLEKLDDYVTSTDEDGNAVKQNKQISQIEECRHGFCSECLFNWLKEHDMCPMCRTVCKRINLCK